MGVPYPNLAPLHHTLLIYPLRTPLSPSSSISINGEDALLVVQLWWQKASQSHPGDARQHIRPASNHHLVSHPHKP
jgi:hypothetical protein